MSIRSVLRIGHPSLRRRAAQIPDDWFGSRRLQTLIDDLFDTKSACSGAGLAAPQINEPWRIFVVGMRHNPRYPDAPPLPERVLINPVIKSIGEESIAGWEGCLSVPGLRGEVERWERIHLQYQDQEGSSHREKLHGFHARVIQHENDHLDGILFPDRLTSSLAFGFTEELQAYGKIP
ncbi:Peptide deformylase [Synechococcus sp. MIT S9509]|uniref:peptide deformylase n=1 Tax=unclassified Synechococcus TaxID=2626047 RepID=UPI0007BC2CDC|nr:MULTISPECIES: peptide deformylase [unclassified Synechococcus]KZR87705.1 Peptide deformylase [Synechococcus sp. MIT S9504]KZR93213.1 Peptide deformylase [Synechococcus sp. MIT S9509]